MPLGLEEDKFKSLVNNIFCLKNMLMVFRKTLTFLLNNKTKNGIH